MDSVPGWSSGEPEKKQGLAMKRTSTRKDVVLAGTERVAVAMEERSTNE